MSDQSMPITEYRGFYIYHESSRIKQLPGIIYFLRSGVSVHRVHNDEWIGSYSNLEEAEFAIKSLTEVETAKAFEQEILGIKHGKESSSKKRSKRRSISKR